MADRVGLLTEQDDTVEFGAEDELGPPKRFQHPVAVGFHLSFKALALLSYLLGSLLSLGFVINFIIVIILLAMDFWTTKNVSGRLLVGLRWWNYIDDDGKSHWMYESKQGKQRDSLSANEGRVFWASLFTTQILWILFIFLNIFRFNLKWLVVVVIANILNGANLYGYIKCRVGGGKSIKEYATGMVSKQMFSAALSSLTKRGGSSSEQSAPPVNIV